MNTLSKAPALNVKMNPITENDGIEFSWEPLTNDPQVVGYQVQEVFLVDGEPTFVPIFFSMNRAARGYTATKDNSN